MEFTEDVIVSMLQELTNDYSGPMDISESVEFDGGLEPRNLEQEFDMIDDDTQPIERTMVYHIQSSEETGMFECPICWDTFENKNRMTITCGHHYCASCIEKMLCTAINNKKTACCALCRYSCTLIETPNEELFHRIGNVLNEKYEQLESSQIVNNNGRQNIIDNINRDIEYLVLRQMAYDQMVEDQSAALLSEAMQNPEQRYSEMYMP